MSRDDTLSLVGTVVAEKYRVDDLVAEGGFALLYRATHQIWNRPVALKVFKALGDAAKANKEELLANFIREGALLAELSERSASICQARDVGMLVTPAGESIPFMVLEWLEGMSLENVLTDEAAKRLPPRTLVETMNLLGPIGEALALAHTLGVAHRDVKPANIFLLGDPRAPGCPVKLLDFGIAKVVMDAQKAGGAFQSTTGTMTAFTPSYAAPEQFSRTHGPTGPWTDTFALALVVTELMTGRTALDGDDFLQIAYAATNPDQRPTPRSLGAVVSDEVEAVFQRALAIAPSARYATVGEFWNALRVATGQDPLTLAPLSSWGGGQPPAPLRPSVIPGSVQAPRSGGLPAAPLSSPALSSSPASAAGMAPAGGLQTGSQGFMAPPANRGLAVGLSVGAALLTLGAAAWVGLTAIRYGSPSTTAPVASASPAPFNPSSSASGSSPSQAAPPPPTPACPVGMVYVPGGQFFMGSDDGLPMEKPSHNVKLAPFCIDIYEVTTAKYLACSDQGKCKRASKTNEWDGITAQERKSYDPLCNIIDPATHAQYPINCVDWERADTFCRAAGERLPTEAEWEFAARGSDGRQYPWGDEAPAPKYLNACGAECLAWGKAHRTEEKAMYKADDGWPNTAPVGSFPAGKSRYGLMDVVGNVWEWVGDWYEAYPKGEANDPKGPATGKARVIRGGAWNGAEPSWVRPTFRYMNDPATASHGVGFRCAADTK
jgi:formylglycine-generating enzyme required for sulfatase activity